MFQHGTDEDLLLRAIEPWRLLVGEVHQGLFTEFL